MRTDEELRKYKEKIKNSYGNCSILTANRDTTLSNCNETSNREAEGGWSWIDYWRAMTGCNDTQLTCSSCGELIFVGEVPKIMNNLYRLTNDSPERHKAVGGHISVKRPQNGKYSGGRYITPLCPVCNAKRGETIPILKGTKICKELGANINDAKQ